MHRTLRTRHAAWAATSWGSLIWAPIFNIVDDVLRLCEPLLPKKTHRLALDAAMAFVSERLNGDDVLGAIYPAMANTVMMFDCLGVPETDPRVVIARAALKKLLVNKPGRVYVQPWFVAGLGHRPGGACAAGRGQFRFRRVGAAWARLADPRQVLDLAGDWAVNKPGVRPGGWAFQYANPHYPDLDDTAMVALAFDRCDRESYREPIARSAEWLVGLTSKNGGWAAFDADNTYYYLNYIPFADHGALLDPPTADVSARCVGLFGQIGGYDQALAGGIEYLRREQEADGSWFGRWGTNYIYGTWSALIAFNAAGVAKSDPMIRRAVAWLLSKQRADGGWGEDGRSYWPDQPRGANRTSTPSQNGLGGARADGGGRERPSRRGARYRASAGDAEGARALGRGRVHGGRLPARVLSALSRLPRLFPALGAGALSQPVEQPSRRLSLRHVMRIAAVTGMETEARVARRAGIEALPSGGVPAQTRAIAERFLSQGVDLLLSFGIAGALAPTLVPGDLLLPTEVIDDTGNHYSVDAHWHAQVDQALRKLGLLNIEKGILFGAHESIAKIAIKVELFHQKQSVAVDLESHIVAAAAVRFGTPFLALRAVADSASRALPPAAVIGLGADGKPALGRVLLSVARDPRQIPALIRLAGDTQKALAALDSALKTKPF